MPTFTVAAGEQDLVVDVFRRFGIQRRNYQGKSLPLSQWRCIFGVGWIALIDEAEVGGSLCEGPVRWQLPFSTCQKNPLHSQKLWRWLNYHPARNIP